MFRNCDFFNTTANGEPLVKGDKPELLGNGNIAWPSWWTEQQARQYRQDHGLLPSEEL